MRLIYALVVLTAATACARTDSSDTPRSGRVDAESWVFNVDEVGTVNFPVSCNESAAEKMAHGLALLHHMAYTAADLVFQAAFDEDASCSLAYWGRAMTLIHPLWPDTPTPAELDRGSAFVNQALALGPQTERERAYIDAVAAYFQDAHDREASDRRASFYQGWQKVHERFPEDWEATAFYVLSGLAVDLPRESGGALMEELRAEIPDHPAAHHYAIHAYDTPTLAPAGIAVARSYGELTPEVPHALHMPTHIFTQLGLWSDSIDLNERSAAAAWEQGQRNDSLDVSYPHAMSYLLYAYLQTGQDSAAQAVRDRAAALEGPFSGLNITVFAAHLAEIPVVYALDRHDWGEATRIQARQPTSFPWDERFAQYDALAYFSHAIGHARSGDPRAAREAVTRLQTAIIGTESRGTASYLIWDGQTMSMAADAWALYAEGETDRAVTMMEAAADRGATSFDGSWKLPLPPGELLGDMYLELGRDDLASTAYEAVLDIMPNRLNSLCGAARAAARGGKRETARVHYETLIQVADPSSSRACLRTARDFVTAE